MLKGGMLVYDSLYALFGVMRDLLKDIPAERVRDNEDTKKLIELMLEALNTGMRPHMTKWQARFRRWYATELSKHPDDAPQVVQRRFCDYAELEAELIGINQAIARYSEFLRKLSHGS